MAVQSNDKQLDELLKNVENGKVQLPDFQRSWVWDDMQIRKLIESITSGYPMGAAMFLANGGDNIRFKSRPFESIVLDSDIVPEWLVLDGQQRLTTLYQVFKSPNAAITRLPTKRDATIRRYYYLDMEGCLNPEVDRLDAIISVSESKQITSDIGRNVILDLSTSDKEFENKMFPLNIVFSSSDVMDWMMGFLSYYNNDTAIMSLYKQFFDNVLKPVQDYKLPVIQLDKDTPKEAVCQIFENVNTGGVPLTVFELITATFAADNYELRKDWDSIKKTWSKKSNGELLKDISGANYLAAMTLLASYNRKMTSGKDDLAVSCKKRDILKLTLDDYKLHHDALVQGFACAADFLVHQGIYRSWDVPYSTQLIPLAAIYAYDNEHKKLLHLGQNKELLARWYWCGVFGELYGSANEARFALDIQGMFRWMDGGDVPETVARSSFQPTRLISMYTRNSAAYKGVMALILQDSPLDFMTGSRMDIASYIDEDADIHHIFPQAYCERVGLPKTKWNSVINKTPIYASSNRSIGGHAPSAYVKTMFGKGLSEDLVKNAIESHKVNYDYLVADDFDAYFIERAKQLLNRIEKATGKAISGRDSEETINEYGQSLLDNQTENPSADSDFNEEILSERVIYSVLDIRLKDEQECQHILDSESFEEYVRVLANRNPYLVQYGFKKYQYKFLIDLLKASEAARLNWESFLESDGTTFEEYKKAHYSECMILYDETYNDVKLPEEDAVEDTGTPLSDDEIHQRLSLLRELPELLGWEPFMTILNE